MKYILALNYQEFTWYCQQNKLDKHDRNIVFISTSYPNDTVLLGRRIYPDDEVLKVGNYAEGKYLPERLGELEMARA